MKTILLNNGVEMPCMGLGTYPLTGKALSDSVRFAYLSGYRMFDTADNYYNEADLGIGLNNLYQNYGAKREECFLVTKISDELYRPGTLGGGSNRGVYFWKSSPKMQSKNAVRQVVNEKVDNSLRALNTDYIDLLLMHWPYPDFFIEIWHEMEDIYKSGKVRAIGLCNCMERHINKLLVNNCSVLPMVNQIECSPINSKVNLVDYCNMNRIKVMVYSPLMNLRLKSSMEYHSYLDNLSSQYRKSKSQIILRFDIQRGLIPIPKSSRKERIESNIDVFDFELTGEEFEKLLSFNQNTKYMPESKSCPGL